MVDLTREGPEILAEVASVIPEILASKSAKGRWPLPGKKAKLIYERWHIASARCGPLFSRMRRILRDDPNNQVALIIAARTAGRLSRYDDQLEYLQRLLSQYPNVQEYQVQTAHCLFELGRFKAAINFLRTGIPKKAQKQYGERIALEFIGRIGGLSNLTPQSAAEDLAQDPANAKLALRHLASLRSAGDHSLALRLVGPYRSRFPDHAAMFDFEHALLCFRTNNVDEAESRFRELGKTRKFRFQACKFVALSLAKNKKFNEALAYLDAKRFPLPEDRFAAVRSKIFAAMQNHSMAVNEARRALVICPNLNNFHELGMRLAEMGAYASLKGLEDIVLKDFVYSVRRQTVLFKLAFLRNNFAVALEYMSALDGLFLEREVLHMLSDCLWQAGRGRDALLYSLANIFRDPGLISCESSAKKMHSITC